MSDMAKDNTHTPKIKVPLEKFLNSHTRVLIDTCSILEEHSEQFFEYAIPILREKKAFLVIPKSCVNEIEKHKNNTGNVELSSKAKRAIKILALMQKENLIQINSDEDDGNFADNVFLSVFMKYRIKYTMVLITQDTNLAQEIENLNNSKAVSIERGANRIYVFRIDKHGLLNRFYFKQEDENSTNSASDKSKAETPIKEEKVFEKTKSLDAEDKSEDPDSITDNIDEAEELTDADLLEHEDADLEQAEDLDELDKTDKKNKNPKGSKVNRYNQCFKVCTKVTTLEDSKIGVSTVPEENSTLYTSKDKSHSIVLLKKLAAGGEGYVFETNTEYVAKIYKPENNTVLKKTKIELMLSRKIKYQGICTPVEALYNGDGVFVGYLMPKATGKELQRCIFVKPLLLKNFPNWNKADLVQLCITILRKIKFLHDKNIILGDINPANILVESPKKVYFVDTDSYQIEDLPCPVGTINYTAPEIQGKAYKTFLRTMGNEQFAVATLLFMIMLPGKPPYAQQGGESAEDNIKKMDFPYPFGDLSNGKVPDGPWKFIWSHLPFDLKQAFYYTFTAGQKYSTENKRLDESRWLMIFSKYKALLESGKLAEQDPMSLELFPTRHKNSAKNADNVDYIVCKLCGQKVQKQDSRKGICNTCLAPTMGELYNCKCCGKQLIYTNMERYIKGKERYPYCDQCSKEVVRTLYCVDCGKPFTLTRAEIDSFNSKGLSLPKRCKSCRDKIKNSPLSGGVYSSRSSGSSSYGSRGSYSYSRNHRRNSQSNYGCSFVFFAVIFVIVWLFMFFR